jgi:predicted RNase H-related nuclease YkuK (DUF458 family)
MLFKKLTSNEEFDVAKYVKAYFDLYKDEKIQLFLGCDSQNSFKTTYATTLVFNVSAGGCHIIYKKDIVPLITDMWTRLWGEAERSVETALYLREKGIEINTIDLDYNINPKFKSNKLVTAAVGYVESLGFKARIKPELLPAVYAADHIVG